MCSGSGCLGITLSLEYPNSHIDLVEISDIAIENINSNIKKFGCNNINVIHSDIFDMNFKETYDIIISNPPYIDIAEIHNLDHTVRYYDPINALTDHGNGLSFYHKISSVIFVNYNFDCTENACAFFFFFIAVIWLATTMTCLSDHCQTSV